MVCCDLLKKANIVFSIVLALNTMETLISDIGVDSNTVVVMALMNAPDEKSLVRIHFNIQVK